MNSLAFVAISASGQRYEWQLEAGEYQVGRGDGQGHSSHLSIAGDPHLSRQHFSVHLSGQNLCVRRHAEARNPVFYNGQQADDFEIGVGQFFTAGKSQFALLQRQTVGEQTLLGFSREQARLRRLQDCFTAVIQLLECLRQEPTSPTPWRAAFKVIVDLLPQVEQLMFVEISGHSQRILDWQGKPPQPLPTHLISQALEQYATVTLLEQVGQFAEDQTVTTVARWCVLSPLRGLESSSYALSAAGSGYLEAKDLEEVAVVIDLVAELVAHHLVVQQASEYSNLLGVFGHHIGTLFKTSGALGLWSDHSQSPQVRGVIDRLLPVWGVSQAIALHKKQADSQGVLPSDWVGGAGGDPAKILESLRAFVAYQVDEEPFLPWFLEGERLHPQERRLLSLPPLNDNPIVLDKTLALTIGLLEMLHNVRKYPQARGSGREDRRELLQLEEAQRQVHLRCYMQENSAIVEVEQPVVLTGDNTIPGSRSLERIRALESRLLGGLVETRQPVKVAETGIEHIWRIGQSWVYHWGYLLR